MSNREQLFFQKVSEVITGCEGLPIHLTKIYFQKLNDTEGYNIEFSKLLKYASQEFNNLTLQEIFDFEIDKNVLKGITFLWYTSELVVWEHLNDNIKDFKSSVTNRIAGSASEYYGGLIWKVIRAHPLGLSGGYQGYWKYEPEN